MNREYGTRKRTVYPFKIKETSPEQRTVNITKNGQVVKTINEKENQDILPARIGSSFECKKIIVLLTKNIFNQVKIASFSSLKILNLQMSHKLKKQTK